MLQFDTQGGKFLTSTYSITSIWYVILQIAFLYLNIYDVILLLSAFSVVAILSIAISTWGKSLRDYVISLLYIRSKQVLTMRKHFTPFKISFAFHIFWFIINTVTYIEQPFLVCHGLNFILVHIQKIGEAILVIRSIQILAFWGCFIKETSDFV